MTRRRKRKPRLQGAPDAPDELVCTVATLRIRDGLGLVGIAKYLAKERDLRVTPQYVHRLIQEGYSRKFVTINRPPAIEVAEALAEAYAISPRSGLPGVPRIRVVNAHRAEARNEIPGEAADVLYGMIEEAGTRKGRDAKVHVAYSSGWAGRRVLRALANRLHGAPKGFPKIVFHAACPGTSLDEPKWTANAFSEIFRASGVEIEWVTFPASPLVTADQYEDVRSLPPLSEAFAWLDEIDIVVTSMGAAADANSDLRRLFARTPTEPKGAQVARKDAKSAKDADKPRRGIVDRGRELFDALRGAKWIGDILFNTYSASGPIDSGVPLRAMTLFTIPDLVRIAHEKNKGVLLICGPCMDPKRSRSEALVPLLKHPSLRVWSHLVLDRGTAEEVTRMANAGERSA